jgi:hypothetical protein
MKIAVASQNRKQVTGHTGRCRRFWIYEVEAGRIVSRTLLELPIDQSFHAISPQAPHPLDGVQVLISGGVGEGLDRHPVWRFFFGHRPPYKQDVSRGHHSMVTAVVQATATTEPNGNRHRLRHS